MAGKDDASRSFFVTLIAAGNMGAGFFSVLAALFAMGALATHFIHKHKKIRAV